MSETTPEEYRRHYFALKEKADAANARRPAAKHVANPKKLKAKNIVVQDEIPPGWYWTRRIARGQTLRIVNDGGTHGVSALFWNASDTSERYNAGDTVKVQWTARISRGKLLLSDMGRVLASITDDTCGFHDSVVGGSTRALDDAKFGPDPVRRNSRENFILAAGKHGLGVRDVGPCITFFAPVTTDKKGKFVWQDKALAAGQYVDLRAEMDGIVALSNCPHPLSPANKWQAKPVTVQIWRSPKPEKNDLCRTATEEARRAFENTDAMLAEARP